MDYGPKFPQSIGEPEEMRAKLCAAYELHVEQRGDHVIWDDMANESVDSVISWMYDEKHKWLILYGSLGNGKTTMLKSLKTVFSRLSLSFSAQKLYDYFKDNERLPDIPNTKILLIDDLGAEPIQCKIFGEDRAPLTELLMHRYAWNATTVIATNLTFEDIQTRYGVRIIDRMAEMATAILYDTPSYRGR